MTHKKEQENLWKQVGNKCLEHALALLDEETATNTDNIKAVGDLVAIATSIDMLNLRWMEQRRCREAFFHGQTFGQAVKES